jgi:hypothetical protein
MRAAEILETVAAVGGKLWADGETLRMRLPESLRPLVEEIRVCKPDIMDLLAKRPAMPPGVRLLQWDLLAPPVQLNRYSTVIDPDKFAERTLEQLGARLWGDDWGAGNWSVSELIARLECVGVLVELLEKARWLH